MKNIDRIIKHSRSIKNTCRSKKLLSILDEDMKKIADQIEVILNNLTIYNATKSTNPTIISILEQLNIALKLNNDEEENCDDDGDDDDDDEW